jgi:lipopolysaccharide heptosyltransferase II
VKQREFRREIVDSILVIRLYFVGDVLLSTPVFEALKSAFPEARLAAVIKKRARGVVEGNPFVDDIIEYDAPKHYHSPRWIARLALRLRRAHYGLGVDLTGDLRSSWLLLASDPAFRVGFNHAGLGFLLDRRLPYRSDGHVVDHLLQAAEAVGASLADPVPSLCLSGGERRWAADLLESVGVAESTPFVAISPGANWHLRRWPPDRFGALAALVHNRLGLRSVVVGSTGDAAIADEVVRLSGGVSVSLAGRTDIRQLAAVAAAADAFVGNDSGPMHIAASQGTPVVALFGPNTPKRFAPRGAPRRILWPGFACSPCDQRRCVRESDPCMASIKVDEVLAALESLLEERADGVSVGKTAA